VSAPGARADLARIEGELAAAGWPWNEGMSRMVDALVILIEKGDDGR
jgi:hypothetical protein